MNLQSVHVRCPDCQKLYSVDRGELRSEKPEFECVSCHTRFWFLTPVPLDVKEVQARRMIENFDTEKATPLQQIPKLEPRSSIEETSDMFYCSKCHFQNKKGSSECASCGLVFEKKAKMDLGIKTSVPASSELRSAWERVMEDFSSLSLHENFVKICLTQNNLQYASQQYRLILESNPNEEMALRMREKILNLATATYVPTRRQEPPKRRMSMTTWLSLIGLALIVFGFVIPGMRSVIPLGGAILALGVGLVFVNRA